MHNEFFTDEEIIKKVILGEINSFKLLVRRYQKQIFNIGMRFFKNEDDSYDFVQEVFIKAFAGLPSYRGDSGFRFWLMKVAYNHGVNLIRVHQSESVINEGALPDRDSTPEVFHLKGEIREVLLKAIERLPVRYQICMDLFFFGGLTYSEINTITGFPVNTIKSNVLRSKQILRDALRGTIAEDYNEM